MPKFYITTPIFYPNANLHMGHAYTTVVTDALARYHRLMGDEVYFLTGVDENTEKAVRAAKAAGKEINKYLDEITSNFKTLYSNLNISYDQYIRTTDKEKHWPGAVVLWKKLAEAGDLEKRKYKGLYCVGHESFVTEKDLVDGKCPDHNEAPQVLEEENYFFKLSKYNGPIKRAIEKGYLVIVPESRRNEIMAQLERGLEDISFSRPANKVTLGIPIPDDPSQKMYVWCDALSNYITALGFGRNDDELYKKFWPADVQVLGKDILRFHAAIWPAMLISADLELPKHLLVHGFITSGGKKMSKSLGNVIDPLKLIEEYGAEAVRYYLVRHISPFEDGDLTMESFQEAYNADLANGLGNLFSRVMKMAVVNKVSTTDHAKKRTVAEPEAKKMHEKQKEALKTFNVQAAVEAIWEYISDTDKFIQKEEPFKKVKVDKGAGVKDIELLLGRLDLIAEALKPFLPRTAGQMQDAISKSLMPEKPLFPRKE